MLRKRKRNGKCKYKEVSTQIRERKKVTGETPKQRRTKLVARRRLNVENNPETGGGGHPLIQILKEIDLKKENKQLRKVQKIMLKDDWSLEAIMILKMKLHLQAQEIPDI